MNLIDTADVYGLDWGGTALRSGRGAARPGARPRRRSCATGWCWPPRAASGHRCRTTRRRTRCASACEDSLRRLQVDVIDLYQIHRPDMFTHPADVAATLAALRDEGKIREVGVSNHTPAQVEALQAHLPFPLVSNQPEYSAVHLDPLRDGTLDACMQRRAHAAGVEPAGRRTAGHRRRRAARAARPRSTRIAEREGVDRSHVALAFVLAHPSAPVAHHRHADTRERIAASTDGARTCTSTGPTSTASCKPARASRCPDPGLVSGRESSQSVIWARTRRRTEPLSRPDHVLRRISPRSVPDGEAGVGVEEVQVLGRHRDLGRLADAAPASGG